MRRLRSTLIFLLLGLTTVAVVGTALLMLFLPTLLQRLGCTPYGIRCAVGQVSIRPHPNLTVDLIINYVTLFDPDDQGVALRVKHLTATLDIPAVILARQVMPTEVRIDSPELLLRQLDDGRWNLVALAQEVQQHLQPATRPATLQLPRVSVASGTFQIGDRRITNVDITLEPKPTPRLFEMQARGVVDGRSVQVTATADDTLEGRIYVEVQELLRGTMTFRVHQADRAVTIPAWSFETEGAMVRGTAAIRYGDWPPVYTLTVAQWQADLAVLARRLGAQWLAGLTGMLDGEPTVLQGHWPQLPIGQMAATFKDGELALPAQQVKIYELNGDVRLQYTEDRLRLQTTLGGKAFELLGQQYSNPSLQAVVSIDTVSGDVTAEALRASIVGAQLEAKGSGRRWGRNGLDLMTTELRIEPSLLAQLSHWIDKGVLVTTLTHPSIRLSWPGEDRPWKADIRSRSMQFRAVAINGAATLQNAQIVMQGIGVSGRNLDITLAIGQADVAGRQLRGFRAGITIDPDSIRIPEFHLIAGHGTIDGHASFSWSAPLQKIGVALSVRNLHPQYLFVSTGKPVAASGVTLNADLSADATFGGSQPSTAGGTITLRYLSLGLVRPAAAPAPLLTGIRGDVAFTLDSGLLTIKETALRTSEGLTFTLAGSLPLGHGDRNAPRMRLTVPWTEVSILRSTLTAMTGDQPDTARLTGQFQADIELIGQEYRGALSLQHVNIASSFFHLDSATGVIPLHGRIDQSPTSPLPQMTVGQKANQPHPVEEEYRAALEKVSRVPSPAPFSLTIRSLRYDPIELRNIEVALSSSDGQIAVQRFTFDAWGGRWSGWGTIEPLGRGIALTVLTEGVSLRTICNAFPPIKGYISGRINGMVELVVPGFAINQAQGNAQFWAVDGPQEKRRISRRLIERLAGQQIRYFSLFGVARRFSRGILEVALREGNLNFHELEISHTILGYKDLDVRVSPTFNRIGLAHLLESIGEAIERIRASAESNH